MNIEHRLINPGRAMQCISLITIMAVSLSFASCKKNKPGSGFGNNAPNKTILSCSSPTVQDGMLVFEDEDHFNCYEDYLLEVIGNIDPASQQSEHDVLQAEENQLGHQSLRAHAYAAFEALNAVGWATQAEIPEEHWITSLVTRSILNENREVKIGDYVLRFLSTEFVATVRADRPDMLASVRQLGNNPTIEQILILDPTREYISVASLKNTDRAFGTVDFADGSGTRGTPTMGTAQSPQMPGMSTRGPVSGWQMSGTVYHTRYCSLPGYVSFEGFILSYSAFSGGLGNSIPHEGNYHINFGDGTSADLISSGFLLPSFSHVYSPGTYYPTVSVRSISPMNSGSAIVAQHTYTVVVTGDPYCTKDARGALTDYVVNSSNVIRGKLDYYTWYAFPFNYPRTSLSGYTELHHIDGNGNWNRRKDNQTTLCVKFQDVSLATAECVGTWNPSDYGCASNTNQKYEEWRGGGFMYLQHVTGRHEVGVTGGIQAAFEHSIILCL